MTQQTTARRVTAEDWLDDLEERARKTGISVFVDTPEGRLEVSYYKGRNARDSDGRFVAPFFRYHRQLFAGSWRFGSSWGSLSRIAAVHLLEAALEESDA